MAMAIVWGVMVMASVVCAVAGGRMAQVSSAALEGARAAVELCISLAGVLCLWSGFMELLKQCGLERKLAAEVITGYDAVEVTALADEPGIDPDAIGGHIGRLLERALQ